MKLLVSWLKTNAVKILLISLLVLALLLIACAWWLKVRGFKVSDLLLRLQVANAHNELGHLQTKKAVIETKKNVTKEEIKQIEEEIKEEQKKVEAGTMKIKGMTDDEVINRFNELGL